MYEFRKNSNLSGINAWDVSNTLETFLLSWLSEGLKKMRKPLSRGVQGNSFQIWRQPYHESKGTGEIVDESGRRLLQDCPQCRAMMKLPEHRDDWVTLLEEYRQELMNCPLQLRTKILAIIPPDLETILTDGTHPEVKIYQDIIRFCKARTYHARQRFLQPTASSPRQAA